MVAQQQRALVLKSSEMLKHIAEAPAMRMGWVRLYPLSPLIGYRVLLHAFYVSPVDRGALQSGCLEGVFSDVMPLWMIR